jgi:hypothetical protein
VTVKAPAPQPQLHNRLDIHDRKQFEIKLEYEPCSADRRARYLVEAYLFVPASLNVDDETYPRQDFYSDIHNYIRLKTPVLSLQQIVSDPSSPLLKIERLIQRGLSPEEPQLIYQAKLLACVFRGALRRFARSIEAHCEALAASSSEPNRQRELASEVRESLRDMVLIRERFRNLSGQVFARGALKEKTQASLRLIDEYMSLSVEKLVRKAVTAMENLPRSGVYLDLRRELMAEIIDEENYRKANKLRSVLSPTGDNEEYTQRVSFLKKFCTNILFLALRRERRNGLEELLFAVAAGCAMAFATAVAFWAQGRFSQVSLNFFLILVIGYMMKDRIKEELRHIFSSALKPYLFDRKSRIVESVTGRQLGVCREKVDYQTVRLVPDDVLALRRSDDFITVSEGELAETVIHYQKEVVLASDLLPKQAGGSGVTDIIRLNVERLLRDMDDPEYAMEYVDLEDFSVGHIRAAKRYHVDIAFRFLVDQGSSKNGSLRLARLVLDRDGIKRMVPHADGRTSPQPGAVRSAG